MPVRSTNREIDIGPIEARQRLARPQLAGVQVSSDNAPQDRRRPDQIWRGSNSGRPPLPRPPPSHERRMVLFRISADRLLTPRRARRLQDFLRAGPTPGCASQCTRMTCELGDDRCPEPNVGLDAARPRREDDHARPQVDRLVDVMGDEQRRLAVAAPDRLAIPPA